MNREKFFEYLRRRDGHLFGTSLSQRQVDGLDALLDAGDGLPLPHMAQVLSESHHETGGGMYPVKETVFPHSKAKNPSDATVIARLDRAYAKGQLPWVKVPYWRGGFFGRGVIQLTHEYNYRKASAVCAVDLVSNPGRALDLPISATIAVQGCVTGMFTGKKLSDFDGPEYDHYNARSIVNGDKKANGGKIKAAALEFERALEAAGWGAEPPKPAAAHPDPAEQPQGLLAWLLSLFRGA